MPMKGIFVSLPLYGHVNPSLAVVRELVGRGDEITYYATAAHANRIEDTGASYQPYRDGSLPDLTRLPERTHEVSSMLMRTTASVLERELEAFREARPQYLITDSVAPWGQWVGRILGVPVVTSISTFAFNRHVMAFAVAQGVRPRSARLLLSKLRHVTTALRLHRHLCRVHGVRGPGVMASVMGSSDLNIVYTSRYFQPCAETFDDRFQFVGPMTSRRETATFPWERIDRSRSPIVYVSLGTLFNTDAAFYRNCFEAFADQDLQVIVSTGSAVSRESLGTVPANVIVECHVPQLAVLQRASVFVTHGGMNSVSESLSCAVPMVVVPQMGEQALVGRQVERLGAGVYVSKEEATPHTLRASVHRLLADTRFRRQAEIVRRSFQESGGAARAADLIQSFTRQRSTARPS
jgi:MGT family glycosyltransferase